MALAMYATGNVRFEIILPWSTKHLNAANVMGRSLAGFAVDCSPARICAGENRKTHSRKNHVKGRLSAKVNRTAQGYNSSRTVKRRSILVPETEQRPRRLGK